MIESYESGKRRGDCLAKMAMEKALLEAIVVQSLQNIQSDSGRGIRKFVDLGLEVLTGETHQRFLGIIQDILKNEESPYYEMAERTVHAVDHDKLRVFGINLGWSSFTTGAKQIRALEEQRGYNIPWSLTFRIGGGDNDLKTEQYLDLIEQANALGIFAFFLFPDETAGAIDTALPLITQYRDCDFVLFLPNGYSVEKDRSDFTECSNLMIGIDSMGAGWKKNAGWFRKNRCLYSVYRTFETEQEAEDICTGRWMKEILPFAGFGTICVEGRNCAPGLSETIHRYAVEERIRQWYPTLLVDYMGDNLSIDLLISQGSCFVGVEPDGFYTEIRGGRERRTDCCMQKTPLETYLHRFKKENAGKRNGCL